MGYQCSAGDDSPPVLLATNLEAGETTAVCAEHLAGFFLSGLIESTGRGWEPTAESVPDEATDDETDEDDGVQPSGAPDARPTYPEGGDPDTEDDQDDDDDHDQLAEDHALRDAELGAEARHLNAARG